MASPEEPLTFQYLSCIMFEFSKFQVTRVPKLADCLILAGNITGFAGNAEALQMIMEYWAKVYKEVIYVPGPQEFAGAPLDVGFMVCESLKTICSNIRVVSPDNGSVIFPSSRIRVIGGLLWGLDPKPLVDRSIAVDQEAHKSKTKMTLKDTEALHAKDEEWILSEMKRAKEMNERTIVVTHGCPSFLLCRDVSKYKLVDPVSESLLGENGPDFWIYGAPGDEGVAKIEGSDTTFCVNDYNAREDSMRGEYVISFE